MAGPSGEEEHPVVKEIPIGDVGSTSRMARIPQKYIVNAGRILGLIAYVLDRRHRRIVKRNLRFTHPDWPRDRIRELSKEVFQHLGTTVLEFCQQARFSREDILRRVRVKGRENLSTAINSPGGVILISAHIGNWEMAHMWTSCYLGTPLILVARRVRPMILNDLVLRMRSRFGSVVLDKGGALPKMAGMLRHGRRLALLIDQGTLHSEGVAIRFFGRTVTATPAAAILARRYDSPVLPAFIIREKDGSLTAVVEPPLVLQKTGDVHADIRANTQMMNDVIERVIREYPEQWFWFHKRWKRHYPHLYPEDLARQRLRKEKKKALLRKLKERSSR